MASLGEQLRIAREAKSKSLDDISRDTNISKRYLEALESDNYDEFPSHVYARGFLNTYAEYLGLDCKAILERYSKLTLPSSEFDNGMSEIIARRHVSRRVDRKRVFALVLAFLCVIACLIVLLWLRRS